MTKLILAFVEILFMGAAILAVAQTVDSDALEGRHSIGATGQLFAIQLRPGDRRREVRFAGTAPIFKFDPAGVEIFGHQTLANQSTESLEFRESGDHFKIQNHLEAGSSVEIHVRDKKTQKVEIFRLELKPRN